MTDKTDVLEKIKACKDDIVARAGAGAGKTTALIAKYISELETPRDGGYTRIDQLVALTFTEKAADEMKRRARDKISEKIEEIKKELGDLDGSSSNIPDDTAHLSTRHQLFLSLIRQRQALEGAYISTIHSFCARTLHENPISAGVDPSFTVMGAVDASSLLDTVTSRVILDRLKKRDNAIALLVRDMGFESAGFGTGLIRQITSLIPLIRAGSKAPHTLLQEYEKQLAKNGEGISDAVIELLQLLPELQAGGKKENTTAGIIENAIRTGKVEEITPKAAHSLADGGPSLEKAVKSRKEPTQEVIELAERTANLMKKVGGYVLEINVADSTRAFLNLINDVLKQYDVEKNKKSALDYDDLQEKTRDFLRGSADARRAYCERFVRVLVDEFQDVNDLQRDIITLLAPPGEGRLFVVGDVKQSIYGFRGADVSVFDEVAEKIVTGGGGKVELRVNRRSTPNLIKFTNNFFTSLMKGGSGSFKFEPALDGLEAYRKGAGITSNITRMLYEIEEGKSNDLRLLEANILSSAIQEWVEPGKHIIEGDEGQRPMKYGDVAILLRKFTNLELYENAMRRTGVPYHVVRGRGFYNSQEIRDFINLLSFLDFSGNKLSLASVLRSPFVGISDHAIFLLLRSPDGKKREMVDCILENKKLPADIESNDREKIEVFKKQARKWRLAKERLNISELIEKILGDTGYGAVTLARDQGEQKLANLFKLIELSRAFESGSGGFKNFVSLLKKMEISAPTEALADITGGDENTVKIMTAHQSKGLEFPVVIIADAGAKEPQTGGHAMFHQKTGMGLKYHDVKTGESYPGLFYSRAKDARKTAEEEELKRLLYVAMTRARDRLVLSGSGSGTWAKWIDGITASEHFNIDLATYREFPSIKSPQTKTTPEVAKKILIDKPSIVTKEVKKQKQHTPSLSLSVTELASFRQCPKLYYYQSVMEISAKSPSPPGTGRGIRSHTALGSQVHAFLEKIPLGEGSVDRHIVDGVEKEFYNFSSGDRKKIADNIKCVFLKAPLRTLAKPTEIKIMRETPLIIKLSEPNFSLLARGTTDILWIEGKNVTLVDYKYSKRPNHEARYFFQLKLYALGLMLSSDEVETIETSIVYLEERKNPASFMTIMKMDIADIRKQTVAVAKHIAKLLGKPEKDWPTIDASLCESYHCPFRSKCHLNNKRG